MKATKTLVDEGESRGFGFEEEDVVIAADFSIELCQSCGGEVGDGEVVKRGLSQM
jgi:hypothetical protein